jgi:hypothetical protein
MDVKQSLLDISASKLRKASQIKERIEALNAELSNLIGAIVPAPIANVHRKRRAMSAAARRRISEAAKARWAKWRKNGK